ncbi:protein of anamorsin family, partial [Pseudohyphozyma bogoriensis]
MSPGFILPDDDDVFAPVASAPTADATPAPAAAPAGPAATVLVVGTQAAAADGSYQSLITLLSDEGKVGVEKQMVDRIVDGATTFLPSQFTLISLLLPPTLITSTLVSLLEPALAPGGALQIRGDAAESGDVAGELRMVGLAGTTTDGV